MIVLDVIRARRARLCRINTIGATANAEQQLLLEEEVGTLVIARQAGDTGQDVGRNCRTGNKSGGLRHAQGEQYKLIEEVLFLVTGHVQDQRSRRLAPAGVDTETIYDCLGHPGPIALHRTMRSKYHWTGMKWTQNNTLHDHLNTTQLCGTIPFTHSASLCFFTRGHLTFNVDRRWREAPVLTRTQTRSP
jgi:hypothetical protein